MTTSTAPARPPVRLDLRGESTPVGALLADAWRHRDLLVVLARQDFRSRYRSASLGVSWSVLLPLLQGLVIAVVFSHFAGGGLTRRYIPYVIVGITAWSYLQQSTLAASTAIVDGGAIAGRIYFPRLVLPAMAPTANLPGLAIALAVAEVVALGSGAGVHLTLLLLPAAALLAWLLTVVAGAVLALAHVYSRDVRYLAQAGLMVLFYATPVIYFLTATGDSRALPAAIRPWVLANPATGVVQLTRYAVLGTASDLGPALLATGAWVLALAMATVASYARLERVACDRL